MFQDDGTSLKHMLKKPKIIAMKKRMSAQPAIKEESDEDRDTAKVSNHASEYSYDEEVEESGKKEENVKGRKSK